MKIDIRFYRMNIGDVCNEIYLSDGSTVMVMRVPGGWVWEHKIKDNISCCFIPYNNEGLPQ
jgi:hypothetical protein